MANLSNIILPDGTELSVHDASAHFVILSYGSSTWVDFLAAYTTNTVVYCRASSNANPATGSQTRLAFMAYVNNAENPTEVEFQYYRSIATHTASQQGDQVFVYKLNSTAGWSVTTREAATKIVASTGMSSSYSNGTLTLTATGTEVPIDTEMSDSSTNPVQNKVIKEYVDDGLADKVDKETGKGLSTNDYTTEEKTKLAGIATGAEVNQNAFANIAVGSTTIAADAKQDTLTLTAGNNITLTPDATNDVVTIVATDTTYDVVSKTANGLAPQLPNETTTTKYLRQDGSWQVPPNNTYTAATSAPPNISTSSAVGTSTNYARQDHTHAISLATGDNDGQVKIAGSNVSVKGLGSAAYTNSTAYLAASLKGAANGLAELDANGLVPSTQLPSYVDDVLEYASKSNFPATGETGKIYIALDTNLTYRWSGSDYVEISPSLALGETSSTAYRGDRGKTAYTHATDANRLTTATASGLYKVASTAEGHIASLTAVAKADITALGIPASDTNNAVTQTVTTTSANYEVLFSSTADNTTRTEGARKNSNLLFNPSTGNLQATQLNGVTIGSSPKFTDNNTTYTFANGTNGFTVTPSGGSAQTVTVTPSIQDATTSVSGLMSSSDKTKLNGIATGAEVNQNAFSNVTVGSTTIAADSKTDTLTFAAGSNVTLTPDATNDKVTIAATDTTYNVATLSENGLMSTSDRAFLDDLSYPAYLNGAEVPKGDANNTEQVTNYAVCSTAAATVAKEASTGWGFDLYEGAVVFVKFTVTNTGAVASLTLNVNDTGAKPIKYRNGNLSSASVLSANRIYGFVYDGEHWELIGDLDTNSNTYDRTYINTTFKAATATSASFLLCGTDAGYKNVAKGTAFDVSYPLLYCGTAIAAGGTRSDGYIQIPMNCTTTNGGTSPAFTAYKMVFLKGKLTAGKTFTIDSSTLFTQTVPTSADGFHYYCVGLAGSATNIFLTPHHDVYEYLGGSFHKVSIYAEDAAKVNGLTVQTAVPANAKFTDTTYSVATTSADGLMSSTDKSKLDSHVVTVASTTGSTVSQLQNQNANSLSGTSVNHIKDNRPNTSNPDAFMFQMAYSDNWKSQFVQDPRNNKAYVRNLNNGTWGSWAEVYTSASPSPDTKYSATTTKLVTTTVPNVTNKGTVPSLTITSTACDDITAWTTNTATTPMSASASEGVLTLTAGSKGTSASLSYTARSVGSASGWSAGTTPTLGTAITVATGSTSASGTGATVATGITAS